MSGYVRQSSADILPTAIIRATPVNNEFNALRDAFAQSGGHKHDGTAAEGDYIPLVSDSTAKNKVVVDGTNNRVGVFVNVSGTATEQFRVQNAAVLPVTTNTVDFGSSSYKFKDFYLAGTATLYNAVATTATIATATVQGGTVNNTVIGNTTAQAITGTLITASTGFSGPLTGAVTGNVTGNLTGNVTGVVTGSLTGNVTASTGTSSFNDVTINGGLNMNAGTAATITNLTAPTNAADAATKSYVDTSISNLVASAPITLDTLNEIATALGNDPNLATTLTNSIATKLPLAGGTMSGAIAMGTSKITGLGTPTAGTDATTKTYVDTADALNLAKAGGTMSGAIAMGTNKITGLGDPSSAQDAATKNYIDVLYGSTASAATSAAAAAVSASNAATSESNAATSASTASTAATNAAASYDSFDDRYLGPKSSGPTLDNDGNALLTGALYWDTTANQMRVYTGSVWVAAGSAVNGTSSRQTYTATAGQTTFAITYDAGFVDVYLNGVRLVAGSDFTASSGTNIVLATGAAVNDIVDIIAYGAFSLANTYTQAAADAKFIQAANNFSEITNTAAARTNLGLAIGTNVQAYDADLAAIAALTPTNTYLITGNGTSWTSAAPPASLSAGKAIAFAIVMGF